MVVMFRAFDRCYAGENNFPAAAKSGHGVRNRAADPDL